MAETTVSNEHAVASGSSASPEVLTNFVGGRWVESKARETLDVHNPARGEVIARTPLSTAEDVATAFRGDRPDRHDRARQDARRIARQCAPRHRVR